MMERHRRSVLRIPAIRFLRVRHAVGPCGSCGVLFAGPLERRAHVEQVLRVHERICPGGSRSVDIATPFE